MPKEEIYKRLREIGDRGEELVKRYLEKKGTKFRHTSHENSHLIDFTCERASDGKLFFVEVKTKKSFVNDIEETGFEVKYWNKYVALSDNTGDDIFFIFVDVRKKEAYGHWLSRLKEIKTTGYLPHLLTWGKPDKEMNPCVFFPVDKMHKLFELTNEEVDYIVNGDIDTRQARAEIEAETR